MIMELLLGIRRMRLGLPTRIQNIKLAMQLTRIIRYFNFIIFIDTPMYSIFLSLV